MQHVPGDDVFFTHKKIPTKKIGSKNVQWQRLREIIVI
ncbi:hypothetical protein EPYR_02957 [Erwinia pyrifoliae DSM 12163]|nr:hypothetical protein EPYR_02957 [Erwinia pyrifoliae DSM 12163]